MAKREGIKQELIKINIVLITLLERIQKGEADLVEEILAETIQEIQELIDK